MITERAKYLDFLKTGIFKSTTWTEANLFFTIPYPRLVGYVRSNFKDVRVSLYTMSSFISLKRLESISLSRSSIALAQPQCNYYC